MYLNINTNLFLYTCFLYKYLYLYLQPNFGHSHLEISHFNDCFSKTLIWSSDGIHETWFIWLFLVTVHYLHNLHYFTGFMMNLFKTVENSNDAFVQKLIKIFCTGLIITVKLDLQRNFKVFYQRYDLILSELFLVTQGE